MAKAEKQELQKAESMAVSTVDEVDLAMDAGAGMEGADSESFAIPFLTILQKGSPQVDEDSPEYINGAKAGMILETVSRTLYDGKEGVLILPCAYRRVFLRWGARDMGAGFKGELAPEVVAQMRADSRIMELDGRLFAPLEDGSVNEKKSDRFADTRNHYCILVDPQRGTLTSVLLSLTSTQVRKSKALMSMLSSKKVQDRNGNMFTPATFMNVVKLTTTNESNDKGTWYGAKFELNGMVNSLPTSELLPPPRAIVETAKNFHSSVAKGTVTARYEEDAPAAGAQASSAGGF